MKTKPTSILVMAGALLGCASTVAAVPDYPPLRLHGDELPSACMPTQLAQVYKALALTRVPEQTQAATLLQTLLCKADTPTNRATLKPLVPAKVRFAVAATGDKDQVKTVARDDALLSSLLPAGAAWDANVLGSPNKLVLQYQANEACVKSRTLKFANGKWSVAEIGEACD